MSTASDKDLQRYDYIIVGGGPTGLTLATYLPGRVALVERHKALGGCHRVAPGYPQFVEHGPRVYSGSYVNVARVLQDVGMEFHDVFEPTAFSPELIDGTRWYQWLSVAEIAYLSREYLVFALCNASHGKHISMKTYCAQKNFSARSTAYIDLVCRFSDGAGADRYSLWEFVSGFDQHLRAFYLPRRPNTYMFDKWKTYLERRGVRVRLGANVAKVTPHSVTLGSAVMHAKKVILAIPPLHADRLLQKSGIRTETKFRDFAKKTKYDAYWSVSFFGATLDNAKGQRTTPWGALAMQYHFDGVVSAAASIWDVASPVTGKTMRETAKTPDRVAEEIRRQLGLPDSVTYAYATGPYSDQAFMAAAGKGSFGPEMACGIATVGCHNGKSNYNFTSMESAVQNALAYLGRPVRSPAHAGDALRWGLLAAVLALAYNTKSTSS